MADDTTGAPAALLIILAVGVAVLVANLYYAQPLVASIAPELGVAPDVAGSIVSVAQIGYGTGLFLLVPVADLVENRRLVLTMMSLTVVALIGLALAKNAVLFFIASFLMGICATAAQILLPFVAFLVPEAQRGRVVGNVMACVLTGIMLARPFALFIAGSFGWRAVFWISACLVAAIAVLLSRMMPRHQPRAGTHYGGIMASMLRLPARMPALCWRSAYAALMFGAFNMFWTAAPLMLAARFGLSQHAIALFALAGAGGALAAPTAGRLADRGFEHAATAGAMIVLGVAFLASGWAVAAGLLVITAVLAVIIDAAVQTNQIVSRRTVFATAPAIRGRVNAIYMTSNFIGGAIGSVLGTVTFHAGGWTTTAITGAVLGGMLFSLLLVELRTLRTRPAT